MRNQRELPDCQRSFCGQYNPGLQQVPVHRFSVLKIHVSISSLVHISSILLICQRWGFSNKTFEVEMLRKNGRKSTSRFVCQKDKPCTGAPDRLPHSNELSQSRKLQIYRKIRQYKHYTRFYSKYYLILTHPNEHKRLFP